MGNRLLWAVHIQRMGEDKESLKTKEGGRRSKRLKIKWRDSVKRDHEKPGVSSGEREGMAGEGDRWRQSVKRAEQIK